ncbi:hypothetical protein VH441_01955 [Psychrobacter sp. HD31]|uniref:tetratricopeptide repeat protein n=1 Tax=Psychrobacter sp. HD31 TaxID=3112003 RepID=UPI003DA68E2B
MQNHCFYAKNRINPVKNKHLIRLFSGIAISSSLIACQAVPQTTTQSQPQLQPYQPNDNHQQATVRQPNKHPKINLPVHNQPTNPQIPVNQPLPKAYQNTQKIHSANKPKPSTVEITPSKPSHTLPSVITETPQQKQQRIEEALLKRAKTNSNTNVLTSTNSVGSVKDIPAYRNLMATGIQQLKSGQLANAEASFTHAQRLSPQTAAAYFYLGQIAIKRGEAVKAEAMARRGLTVAKKTEVRQSLWKIILHSAQMRNDIQKIKEAQRALR